MNKKRTKLEVIRDILDILTKNRNVRITHLIYKANLSNNSIKPYIEELMKQGMMEELHEEEQKYFRITGKGFKFLEEFNKIKIFSESYGLDIE